MLRLIDLELYSRWVPLPSVCVALKIALRSLDHHGITMTLTLVTRAKTYQTYKPLIFIARCSHRQLFRYYCGSSVVVLMSCKVNLSRCTMSLQILIQF